MKKCKNCGRRLTEDGMNHCSECGAPIKTGGEILWILKAVGWTIAAIVVILALLGL